MFSSIHPIHQTVVVTIAALLTGCTTAKAPELSLNHPANSNAIESPLPVRASVLKTYWTPDSMSGADASSAGSDTGKGQSPAAANDMPEMDHSQHVQIAAREKHETHSEAHEHKTSSAGQPGEEGKVNRQIQITALDTMRFEPSRIKVKNGETVRFVVTNAGKLAHEFVIGDTSEQRKHAEMMRKMPTMKHEHDNAISLEPGETKNLVWEFGQGGELEIACHVPGHYEAGMRSNVVVGPATSSPTKTEQQDEHDAHKH